MNYYNVQLLNIISCGSESPNIAEGPPEALPFSSLLKGHGTI